MSAQSSLILAAWNFHGLPSTFSGCSHQPCGQMMSIRPSPLKSSVKQQKESLYKPGTRGSNLRSMRRTCRFHSPLGSLGASYQQSPTTMSSLPSLLKSATPTPSERKFLSMTIFFQVVLVLDAPAFSWLPAPAAKNGTNGTSSKVAGSKPETVFMAGPHGASQLLAKAR